MDFNLQNSVHTLPKAMRIGRHSLSKPSSMNSAMVSLNKFWMSSMLLTLAIRSRSQIFFASEAGRDFLSDYVAISACFVQQKRR